MSGSFKQNMRWLHTWLGLITGWFLFAIFVTGTSAYYKEEITEWMKPKLSSSVPSSQSTAIAINKAVELSDQANNYFVSLPNERNNSIKSFWKERTPEGKKRKVVKYFDASTGEEIDTQKTLGGDFLFRFHYKLHGIPSLWGKWIVAIIAMAMFIAIVSGILIHTKIFKDLFVFRPEKRVRNWMDAHILPAVAALPFIIMISYSSLLLSINFMMPWAIDSNYNNTKEYRQDLKKVSVNTSASKQQVKRQTEAKKEKRERKNKQKQATKSPTSLSQSTNKVMQNILMTKSYAALSNPQAHQIISLNTTGIIHQHSSNLQANINPITKKNLMQIYKKAQKIWPNNIGALAISQNKKRNTYEVKIYKKTSSSIFNSKIGRDTLVFDAKTTKLKKKIQALSSNSAVVTTNAIFDNLHRAWFSNTPMRALFFFMGVTGCIIIATGLILWNKKRQQKYENKKHIGYKLVEKINLGTIIGLLSAVCAYFIANKIIPKEVVNRELLEVNVFFIIWLLSYIHAFIFNAKLAWKQQLLFVSLLSCLIPILTLITNMNGFNLIDVFFILCGLLFFIAYKIKNNKEEQK